MAKDSPSGRTAERRRTRRRGCILAGFLAVFANAPTGAQTVTDALKSMLESMEAGEPPDEQADAAEGDVGEPIALTEAEVKVSPGGTVTLNVVDLPLPTVLRVLSLETNRNIITTPGVTGKVTASLHDVTFEEALDAVLVSNQAAYRAEGKFIYVYTKDQLAEIIASENPPQTRVFRLNYVSAKDVESAVTGLLSSIGRITASIAPSTGVDSSSSDAGGASLASSDYVVVYDRPENIAAIAAAIKELDVRPRQVLVEATILSAELTEANALGIDFTILGGVDLELMGSTSDAIQNVSVGALPTQRFEKFNSSIETGFTANVPDGGVQIGIIKDHVALFIEALERITETMVLANPKVLALNKQKGQVIVGRRDGYITTTVTETQAIQTVEFLETGTQLIFRPFIGDDGFVRMELHPEDSIGGLNASNLPFEQTTEVTTNVIVKDGQTILIGGLFREVDDTTRSQIPLLGDVPVLGTLFQSRNDGLRRQEVIILLTVHVVNDQDAYAEQSWAQYEDIERVRVGLRRGQMWHGRERLAQSLYEKALTHLDKGKYDDARWYVRMALHNNPRFLSAIQLQEKMRGRREWDLDSSITREFIIRSIMEGRGLTGPVFSRPEVPDIGPETMMGPSGFDERGPDSETRIDEN